MSTVIEELLVDRRRHWTLEELDVASLVPDREVTADVRSLLDA